MEKKRNYNNLKHYTSIPKDLDIGRLIFVKYTGPTRKMCNFAKYYNPFFLYKEGEWSVASRAFHKDPTLIFHPFCSDCDDFTVADNNNYKKCKIPWNNCETSVKHEFEFSGQVPLLSSSCPTEVKRKNIADKLLDKTVKTQRNTLEVEKSIKSLSSNDLIELITRNSLLFRMPESYIALFESVCWSIFEEQSNSCIYFAGYKNPGYNNIPIGFSLIGNSIITLDYFWRVLQNICVKSHFNGTNDVSNLNPKVGILPLTVSIQDQEKIYLSYFIQFKLSRSRINSLINNPKITGCLKTILLNKFELVNANKKVFIWFGIGLELLGFYNKSIREDKDYLFPLKKALEVEKLAYKNIRKPSLEFFIYINHINIAGKPFPQSFSPHDLVIN